MPPRKIWVPMPESQMYGRTIPRDELVQKYGSSTVLQAELAVVLNLLYMTNLIKPSEFVDAMVMQCERIEHDRRVAAGLESDRG